MKKTNYELLVNKLYEVEEIKKDIWWWIKYLLKNCKWWYCFSWSKEDCLNYLWSWKAPKWFTSVVRYIWDIRKLEERHLFIYSETKKIRLIRQANWIIKVINWYWWQNETYDIITKIQNSKPFHLQDDEVYKQILDYLNPKN